MKHTEQCGNCNGTGRMVRDPDIGTDQECFVCDGLGLTADADLIAQPAAVLDGWRDAINDLTDFRPVPAATGAGMARGGEYLNKSDVITALSRLAAAPQPSQVATVQVQWDEERNAFKPSQAEPNLHQWDDSGERCVKCGDKDWMADKYCSGSSQAEPQQAEPVCEKCQGNGAVNIGEPGTFGHLVRCECSTGPGPLTDEQIIVLFNDKTTNNPDDLHGEIVAFARAIERATLSQVKPRKQHRVLTPAELADPEIVLAYIEGMWDMVDELLPLAKETAVALTPGDAEVKLPPLPEPTVRELEPYGKPTGYRAHQMQAYARAALAQQGKDAEPRPHWFNLLCNLVEGLNDTHWSSWQSTHRFQSALDEANAAVAAKGESK